jgi:hypothetical protein
MRPLLLLLLLAPRLASAEAPAPATPAPIEAAPADQAASLPPPPPPPPAAAPFPRFGLRLEAGVPDGAVAAFVYRPLPWARVSAGPAWNYLGYGLQVGAALSPIRWAVSPVVSVDYGHFFQSDLSHLVKKSSGDVDVTPLLKRVGYDYVEGQLGLEFGSQRGFCFYLRGGIAYLWSDLHGTATSAPKASGSGQTSATVTDPRLRATIPTVKLGFLYFF